MSRSHEWNENVEKDFRENGNEKLKFINGRTVKIIVFSLTFFVLIFGCKNKSLSESPNILWIVSEDNSPFFGCYGDDFATTPTFDKLAKEGILYENAFANAPVCAPARSTIITGMYPPSMGTQNMRSTYPTPASIKFFPEYFLLKNCFMQLLKSLGIKRMF